MDAATRRVRPDHRMVGIADAAAETAQESTVPGEGFLGVSPNEILIATGQDGMDVQLRVEVWEGPPPPPSDHEISELTSIDLPTGRVCIDLTLRGWIPDVLEASPGHYHIKVTAWDRTRVKDLYWEVGRRTDFDPGNPEFADLCAGAHGVEQYLAQLWKSSDTLQSSNQPQPAKADVQDAAPPPVPKRRSAATRTGRQLSAPEPSLEDMRDRERKHP